ncbi:MAG TPA: anti-sigma factor [Candidatus Polarisedimenticolia bacterium]|nr:anti-sigma factor [Candidatus Polarisedimenticolia bacterium]
MTRYDCDQVRDLLPAYVLGALERDEEAAVREHLATCDLHAEAAELGGVVPYLAETVDPVEPPAALRSKIMALAAADLEARRAQAPVPAPAVVPAPVAAPRAAAPERRGFRLSWSFAFQAAAVAVVVALGALSLNLQNRITGLEGDIAAARAYETAVNNVLAAAAEEGSQTVVLGPGEGFASGGIAAIRADGSVVLAMHDLDPTVGTEVYEAWVIIGSDAPIPIGNFGVASAGTASFTSAPTPAGAGAIVALTREPGPGALTPTLPIISLGTAIGPTS